MLLADDAKTAPQPDRLVSPGFGRAFTDHMVTARWSEGRGWQASSLGPYQPLRLDPAASGLHYGQVVFEGLKAFRQPDGRIAVFRPEAHARRFQASALRLAMPEPPEALFIETIESLVHADRDWVPADPNRSLYLRPILIGDAPSLEVRPSTSYQLAVIACVVEGFFAGGLKPVRVWVSETQARVAPGGTGAVKAAGNYAGAYQAAREAAAHGCDQVVWLDPRERRYLEEMGAMNLFLVRHGARPQLVTPPLSGTLLPGVTRDSLIRLAGDLGIGVSEEPIELEDWRTGSRSGVYTEAFACGTAARVTPIGGVETIDGGWRVGDGAAGPVTSALSEALFDIQLGRRPDRHGWLRIVA